MFRSAAALEYGLDLLLMSTPPVLLTLTNAMLVGGLKCWRRPSNGGRESAHRRRHRPRRVRRGLHPSPPSSRVIAAPCFWVRSRGIRRAGGERPDWSSVFLQRREEGLPAGGSAGWAGLGCAGLPPPARNTAAQHCKRHRLCLRRKSLTVCKCFSSLSSYFYSATKHVSEVCRSFEYKGFFCSTLKSSRNVLRL